MGLAMAAATPALAQSPQQKIVEPQIERAASADELSRYFPDKALRADTAGTVVLKCQVKLNHTLENCEVISESPVGFGFGDAAIKVAANLRVSPRVVDGVAQDASLFSTRINFSYPKTPDSSTGASAYYMLTAEWAKRPTPEQVQAAYPAKAGVQGGVATMICHAHDDGSVGECVVANEAPIGQGFGEAALTLAPLFQTNRSIKAPDGETLLLSIPITFEGRTPE